MPTCKPRITAVEQVVRPATVPSKIASAPTLVAGSLGSTSHAIHTTMFGVRRELRTASEIGDYLPKPPTMNTSKRGRRD